MSKAGVETNQQKQQDAQQPDVVNDVTEKAVVEKMTVEPVVKEEEIKQTATAGFQMDSVWEGLGSFEAYSPFVYGVGKRAVVGAAWGGLFGLVFLRKASWRKFSVLYGAGFGLGMCAPTVNQLYKEFFEEGTSAKGSKKSH